jgi:hypothetical protein
VHHPDCGDSAATGQSRRGRVVLQHALEHGLRPTWHGESACEDHDRRSGCVYVDSVDAWFADFQWLTLGAAIDTRERARGEPESGGDARATIRACDVTRIRARNVTSSTCCVASGESVIAGSRKSQGTRCAEQSSKRTVLNNGGSFVEIIPAIMAAPSKLTSCRSGGTGRRARLRGV